MSNPLVQAERRRQLAELDSLLNELEWLNLADRSDVPDRLAAKLEQAGVQAAVDKGPMELIDAVFRLQRPFLRPNPNRVRPQVATRLRPASVDGWVIA